MLSFHPLFKWLNIFSISDAFPIDPEGLQSCHCKDPCTESEYIASVSLSKFPSASYMAFDDHQGSKYYYYFIVVVVRLYYLALGMVHI